MKKVKACIFLLLFFLNSGVYLSQIISPELVSSSGETFINNSLIVDFSIGEIAIESHNASSIITQGFHQPSFNGTDIIQELNLNIKIFPNPTSSVLNLEFPQHITANIIITDMNGREVFTDKITDKKQLSYKLDFLKPSAYYLYLEKGTQKNIYEIFIF